MFGSFRNWAKDDPVGDAVAYFTTIEEKRDEIGRCASCHEEIYGDASEYGQSGDLYFQIGETMIHAGCCENWVDEQPTKILICGHWIDWKDVDEGIGLKYLDSRPTKVQIGGVWINKRKARRFLNTFYAMG